MSIISVTTTQVKTKTGVEASNLHLVQAVFIIESFTGLDLSADISRARDVRALTNAVIWQAAYCAENKVSSGPAVTSVSANGVSQSFAVGSEDSPALAPLAARCLRKMTSNSRYGTVHATPERAAHLDSEDSLNWRPMRGVWSYR